MVSAAFDIELPLLIEAIYQKYHYDFRGYSRASLKRRMQAAIAYFDCETLSQLQGKVLHDETTFPQLLDYLTVQVSEMFRDPAYFRAVRESVVPLLRTYPSLKIWVAGCSTGEEAYSLAILLHEEGLLARSLIYATDINPLAIEVAKTGIYSIERIAEFTVNHRASGGHASLSEYYTAAYGNAVIDRSFARHIVFADHSLATDSVFSEVQFVSCRNVLIYFDSALKDRAIGLFREALCHRGLLGLGAKESLSYSAHHAAFDEVRIDDRIFQKRSVP